MRPATVQNCTASTSYSLSTPCHSRCTALQPPGRTRRHWPRGRQQDFSLGRPSAAQPSVQTAGQPDTPPDPFATMEEYSDNALDKFMIRYFAKKMSDQLGGKEFKDGFEGFVDLSREIMKGRNSKQQQETVAAVLKSLLPPEASERFRKWFPFNKLSAEANAWITTKGFTWLVGPSELKPVELEYKGEKVTWNSGVQIKKCRYLEQSGCVGMCVNMCKLPTQAFFTDEFGLPLTMKPNFEDLSCEMIFGELAPPIEEDEAYGQPCFMSHCSIAKRQDADRSCPKIDTGRRAAAA